MRYGTSVKQMSQILVAALLVGAATLATQAAVVPLVDGNAVAYFDPTDARLTLDWIVDGESHLASQRFFISVDGQPQVNVTSWAPPATPILEDSDSDGSGLNDRVTLSWSGPQVQFDARFTLTGGATGDPSRMAEALTVTNTSNATVTMRLFQYVDLNIGAEDTDDVAQVLVPLRNYIYQFDNEFWVGESVVTPRPTAAEVNTDGTILARLNAPQLAALDNGAPLLAVGDAEWAFQWDAVLAPGESFLISKLKSLDNGDPYVPEPASLALLGVGGLLALRRRGK
jgi:hypothetical protein